MIKTQEVQVWSLVRELRSYKLGCVIKKFKKKKKEKKISGS